MDSNTDSNYQRGYRDGYDDATLALIDALANHFSSNSDDAPVAAYLHSLANDYRVRLDAQRDADRNRPAAG